ncbi:MAG: hypothetical protein QXV17_07375 [Candidatus Micrarchaeaceae archaeon]
MESFFYKGKDLAYIIPTIYSLAAPGTSVYVLSPWLNIFVPLIIPWKRDERNISFLDLIVSERQQGINSIFFVSGMAKNDKETQTSISELTKRGFSINIVENLHSKAVVGDLLMYQGSANLTYSGIYNNIEAVFVRTLNNQEEVLSGLLSS